MRKVQHSLLALAGVFLLTNLTTAQEVQLTPKAKPSNETRKIGGEQSHLVDALAQWLANGNKAEVDLGQLAQNKATSQEVKQFAQKMVKDHTAFLQKLNQFTDENIQGVAGTEKNVRGQDQERRTTAQNQEGQKTEERIAGFRGAAGKHATMEQIGKEAGKIHLQMTKELLNKYQGQDFDMAYIGQQLASHTQMLANLKAMEKHTEGEFQTLVKEGIQTTQSHLKEAQQISDQLQKKAGSSARQ